MPRKTSEKDIRKKKEQLHPRSRKAHQLQRVQLRLEKLQTKRTSRVSNNVFPLLDRITWFQMILEPTASSLKTPEIHDLIKLYLSRHSDDLERLRAEQRPGRSISKRFDQLNFLIKSEMDEYNGPGLQIPDLSCQANVTALKAWDGTKESQNLIKLTRISSKNLI